jgi:hypothetical protein
MLHYCCPQGAGQVVAEVECSTETVKEEMIVPTTLTFVSLYLIVV